MAQDLHRDTLCIVYGIHCVMVAGVTLRSSRLRAGLKTKLKARRVSQRLFVRSFRVRPGAGGRRGGASREAPRVRKCGGNDADRNDGGGDVV